MATKYDEMDMESLEACLAVASFLEDYMHFVCMQHAGIDNMLQPLPGGSKDFNRIVGFKMMGLTKRTSEEFSKELRAVTRNGEKGSLSPALFDEFLERSPLVKECGKINMHSLLNFFALAGEVASLYGNLGNQNHLISEIVEDIMINQITKPLILAGGFEAFLEFFKKGCDLRYQAVNDAAAAYKSWKASKEDGLAAEMESLSLGGNEEAIKAFREESLEFVNSVQWQERMDRSVLTQHRRIKKALKRHQQAEAKNNSGEGTSASVQSPDKQDNPMK